MCTLYPFFQAIFNLLSITEKSRLRKGQLRWNFHSRTPGSSTCESSSSWKAFETFSCIVNAGFFVFNWSRGKETYEGITVVGSYILHFVVRKSLIVALLFFCFFFRGKFAAVRKCTHKITGIEYAAKFIRKRRRSMDQRNDICHEIAVLKLAQNCGHIVNIHEVYETPTEMALVLELWVYIHVYRNVLVYGVSDN